MSTGLGSVPCATCGATIERRCASQKYCAPCSEVRHLERGRAWAKRQPPKPPKPPSLKTAERAALEEVGVDRSRQIQESLIDVAGRRPELAWVIWLTLPYTLAFSKNYLYGFRRGHVYLRDEVRGAREGLILRVKKALSSAGTVVVPAKLWLFLHVQKPNHRGDAINVVDSVCDALKVALGLDDRWFCIGGLDWSVAKDRPRIFMGFGQETCVAQRICSLCGDLKGLDGFAGSGKECSACKSAARKGVARGKQLLLLPRSQAAGRYLCRPTPAYTKGEP